MSQSESRRVAHCMYVEIEFKKKKKKKEILILKVWFYGNSVKLRQSPTHVYMRLFDLSALVFFLFISLLGSLIKDISYDLLQHVMRKYTTREQLHIHNAL